MAAAIAFVRRGPGGGVAGSGAAQGDLFLEAEEPTKA
jgi:aquaporin Z